ncbi:MAG: hypothetical protein ACRCV9_01025, partial [Burkholderiaceae bacterium]
VGANHNIADVKTVNDVSLIVGNSAGLVVAGGGAGGMTPQQESMLRDIFEIHGLDPAKPLQVTDTQRSAGAITQAITSTAPATGQAVSVTRQS